MTTWPYELVRFDRELFSGEKRGAKLRNHIQPTSKRLIIYPELEPYPMDIFNFYPVVEAQVFAQTRDKYIQTAAKEIIIFAPDGFEYV
jgi:hypothetical protein